MIDPGDVIPGFNRQCPGLEGGPANINHMCLGIVVLAAGVTRVFSVGGACLRRKRGQEASTQQGADLSAG